MKRKTTLCASRIAAAIVAALSCALGTACLNRAAADGPCGPHWDTSIGQPGMNGSVAALIEFDDGSGPAIYAGGAFTMAGGVEANRVARWDGSQWHALGDGLNNTVLAMAVYDDGQGPALYVGGHFTEAGGLPAYHVAKWDGSQWHALGEGTNGPVRALVSYNHMGTNLLVIGGAFDGVTDFGDPHWNVVAWNGSNLVYFGSLSSTFEHLEIIYGALMAGVTSSWGGGLAMYEIYDDRGDEGWEFVTWPLSDSVLTVALFNNEIHIGGTFTGTTFGQPLPGIAKWSFAQANWSPLGAGVSGWIYELLSAHDVLYVGGFMFYKIGGVTLTSMLRWDGKEWSTMPGGATDFAVAAMTTVGPDEDLYVGGSFTHAGGQPANSIAIWRVCPPVPGDLDGDGVVGVADLLILLENWGECADCPDTPCIADLTGDCSVGVGDLLILLANWG